MTSIPVNNNVKGIVPGSRTMKKANTGNTQDCFSDIFKNQKKDGGMQDAAVSSASTLTEKQSGRVSAGQNKLQNAERHSEKVSAKDAGQKVDEAADRMLKKTAKELSVTEEELLFVLQSLSLTPADLLTQEGLQQAVLAVSGENDMSGFLTNEGMFASLQNLTGEQQTTLSELSRELGIDQENMESFLAELSGQSEAVVQAENAAEEPLQGTDRAEGTEDGTGVLTGDGTAALTEETTGVSETQNKESGKQTGKDSGRNEKSFGGENTAHAFDTNLKATETQQMQNTSAVSSHFDVDTENIIRQITDYMRGRVTDGVSEMDMQLHPANLGSVHIHLEAKEGVLTAQFTAQNESVKAALESQMITLQDSFKEQGITVESIEVMVSSQKFEQSYEESGSNSHGDDSRPARTRSRKVSLRVSMEDEELSEEEILTKEILKEQGSTVEFTA